MRYQSYQQHTEIPRDTATQGGQEASHSMKDKRERFLVWRKYFEGIMKL
jgi:hypothetical protein